MTEEKETKNDDMYRSGVFCGQMRYQAAVSVKSCKSGGRKYLPRVENKTKQT